MYVYKSIALSGEEELKWELNVPEYIPGSMTCSVTFTCNTGMILWLLNVNS